MAKDYTLEIIEDSRAILPRLRVVHKIEEHWVNTFADLAEGPLLDNMGKWCEENECGHRTSYNEFKFRNKEQMSFFILRWS